MTLITPGLEEARIEELFASMQDSVRTLRKEFQTLKERVEQGEDVKTADVKSKISEMNAVVINCNKLESSLEHIRHKQSRIAQGGYALDLASARSEVWCALGRLRACPGAKGVSE
ncbi:MAG: hypothetical protein AAFQ19_12285 [Pseudomonadota bacterium]